MAAYIMIGGDLLDFDEFVAKYGDKKPKFQAFQTEEIDDAIEEIKNNSVNNQNDLKWKRQH